MNDRIPCINPKCRRTAAAEKMPGSAEMVCWKCWKLLPASVRRRDRELRRRWKIVERLKAKGNSHRRRGRRHGDPSVGAPQWYAMNQKLGRVWRRHWEGMRAFFLSPERPEGLSTFLDEMGWKD